MRILVTNDDGINAPGLAVLEAIARAISDDVWVVAPAEEQSGAGHSLTLVEPIRLHRFDDRRFAVRGTPTDCVMMALGHVMRDARPDLVLSGVNRGGNLAEDVTYSGTVSAAMEGTLYGVRSIALSQAMSSTTDMDIFFDCARGHGERVVRALVDAPWEPGVLLNVNFPAVPASDVADVRVTEQAFRDLGQTQIVERVDVRGFPYYWFGLGREATAPGHDTDLKAMRERAISVTPLHLDLTHYPSIAALRQTLGRLNEA